MATIVTCPNIECARPCHVNDDQVCRRLRCLHCHAPFVVTAIAEGAGQTTRFAEWRPASVPKSIGKYQILAWLGTGGFNTVYRAHDPRLHRDVAIKVPIDSAGRDSKTIERLLREARAAGILRHAHIVPVFEASADEAQPFIASGFIDGLTVDHLVGNGPLDVRQAAQIGHDIADALAYAHAQGVVHRDVKSSNVIVDRRGEAHLMDFGLAYNVEQVDGATLAGDLTGTPAYVAPEQLTEGGGRDFKAGDQYSLGVVLNEALTGQLPFVGTAAVVLHHIVHSEPTPLRKVRPEIPADLASICQKAMAKDPKDRYASCGDLAADLRRWLDKHPRSPRGYGMKATAVALGLLLLSAALFGVLSAPFLGKVPPSQNGIGIPPKPKPHPLADAQLYWPFEKETLYKDKRDNRTYAKDVSGKGNDGRYQAMEFIEEGRKGGALRNDGKGWMQAPVSFIKHNPKFTITGWVRWDGDPDFELVRTAFSNGFPSLREPIFMTFINKYGAMNVSTFDDKLDGDKWRRRDTAPNLFKKGEWNFIAIRFENGDGGLGTVHMRVNDHKEGPGAMQMVRHPLGNHIDVFNFKSKGAVDEVALWNRFLTDDELDVLYKDQDAAPYKPKKALLPTTGLPWPLDSAKLVWTFEASTFREINKKTYVLDQTIHRNHGLCEDVDFITAGKAGGGLHCEGKGFVRLPGSLINRQKDFTITAWVRFDKAGGVFYDTVRTGATVDRLEPVFHVAGLNGGAFHFDAWNANHDNKIDKDINKCWFRSRTRPLYERGKWCFLAIVLRNGRDGNGELLVRVDDKSEKVDLQMVKGLGTWQDLIGRSMTGAIDELAIWQRSLSTEELDVLFKSNGSLLQ